MARHLDWTPRVRLDEGLRRQVAWQNAGQDALAIYLIEDIEKILKLAAKGVAKVKIGNVSMIDAGDGRTLTSYVSSYPAMLSAILKAVADTTGLDISNAIAGRTASVVDLGAALPAPAQSLIPAELASAAADLAVSPDGGGAEARSPEPRTQPYPAASSPEGRKG